jgi:deazaflavin-dependent oxidoreductase (nitroreductase family)
VGRDPGVLYRWFWAYHRFVDRLTGGRVDPGALLGTPALWLTTVGRKTGVERRSAAWYVEDGPNLVIVGSHAGSDRDPAWWTNLRAHPDTFVRIGRLIRPVRARQAYGEEAERLWQRWVAKYPSGARYRVDTSRELPIVVLEPR